MPTNLELKAKLDNFRKIKSLLKKINAEHCGILNQRDTYFKAKGFLLKLRRVNGEYELIKYIRDEKTKKRWSNFELLKIEGKNPEKYLSSFLKVEAVVEKKRELYMFKNTRIHLDTVKGLGKFIELETIVDKGKIDAQKRFNELVDLLDLDLTKQIKTSYRFLIKK